MCLCARLADFSIKLNNKWVWGGALGLRCIVIGQFVTARAACLHGGVATACWYCRGEGWGPSEFMTLEGLQSTIMPQYAMQPPTCKGAAANSSDTHGPPLEAALPPSPLWSWISLVGISGLHPLRTLLYIQLML